MKILILGSSGLVGGNCLRYFSLQDNCDVVGTYYSYQTINTFKFDTLNLSSSDNFDIYKFQPNVIIHCGALTWVDYCEKNKEESYIKTVQSTINIVELSKKLNCKLVYISTDYVFDGKNGPYIETDKVNPKSVYGKHKLEAEKIVKTLRDYLILRITNVYGDEERNKNFISRIVQTIQNNEELELKLPYDQYATPINAKDIARALYLLLKENHKGVFHIASTDFINRVQLANKVLHYFPNHKVNITYTTTNDLKQSAERPLMGGLIAKKFLEIFPDFIFSNVDDYLIKIKNIDFPIKNRLK